MQVSKIKSLLIDTNVWLDYFLGEGPNLEAISKIISIGYTNDLMLLYTPTSAKDLFYLIPRRLKRSGGETGESYVLVAWACVKRMMGLATAAPLTLGECELARMLGTKYPDFEDNLVLAAGETVKADYIVTQDKAFIAQLPEACITPARAVELLSAQVERNPAQAV